MRDLRAAQFPEDAGPTAHPIRPDSYIAMDNFYTMTVRDTLAGLMRTVESWVVVSDQVYEKGAQVIKMYATLLGEEGFRKGMDLYFERHDGAAVTCDDFRAAMADANGVADGLAQFETWYSQAGTPEVVASSSFDATTGTYTLELTQSCAPSPGQQHKEPYHIPVAVGLVDRDSGNDLIGAFRPSPRSSYDRGLTLSGRRLQALRCWSSARQRRPSPSSSSAAAR